MGRVSPGREREGCGGWHINKSYQLDAGDVLLPPQVLLHGGTQGREAIVSIHHHVHKAVHHGRQEGWNIGGALRKGRLSATHPSGLTLKSGKMDKLISRVTAGWINYTFLLEGFGYLRLCVVVCVWGLFLWLVLEAWSFMFIVCCEWQ